MAQKKSKEFRACRVCKRILLDTACPEHGEKAMSPDWYGFLIIVDDKNSKISQRAEIKKQFETDKEEIYAIKVR